MSTPSTPPPARTVWERLYAAALATGKALAAAAVAAAAYLVGILSGDQTLADLTTVQWLGLVVFLGGAYGLTYHAPYRTLGKHRRDEGDGKLE